MGMAGNWLKSLVGNPLASLMSALQTGDQTKQTARAQDRWPLAPLSSLVTSHSRCTRSLRASLRLLVLHYNPRCVEGNTVVDVAPLGSSKRTEDARHCVLDA